MDVLLRRQVEVVRKYIGRCIEKGSPYSYYLYDNMPKNILKGALESYVNCDEDEYVIGIIDTTVLGGGQRGMTFTNKGIYYKALLESAVFWMYGTAVEGIPDDETFNGSSIIDFLHIMALLDFAPFSKWVNTFGWSEMITNAKDAFGLEDLNAFISEIMSESTEAYENYLGKMYDLSLEILEYFDSPENWFRLVEKTVNSLDSDEIEQMLVSLEFLLEEIVPDFEDMLCIWFMLDAFSKNLKIFFDAIDIEMEEFEMYEKGSNLFKAMAEAVEKYYNEENIGAIVFELKDVIDAFAVEIEYDIETLEILASDEQ